MRARLAFAAALLAALVAAAAASASPRASAALPAGASVAPASAPIFVSVASEASGPPLQAAAALARRFPSAPKLLQQAQAELGKGGLDLAAVQAALGSEVDVVWLDLEGGGRHVVALVRPDDPEQLAALLRAINADAKTSGERVHDIVFDDGWYVIGKTSRILARYRAAVHGGPRLASAPQFASALAAVPGDALGRIYVSGAQILRALPAQARPALQGASLEWLAGALAARETGAALDVVAASRQAGAAAGARFEATLARVAPADVYAFASFRGGPGIGQALRAPQLKQVLGPLALLGIGPRELARLLSGEGAIWIRHGGPLVPEVTLVVEVADARRELATLDRLAGVLARGRKIRQERVGAVTARTVDAGPVALWWAAVGGRVVVSDRRSGIASAAGGGPRLADDPAFRRALRDAGMPRASGPFLYAALARAIPEIERVAVLRGARIDAETRANLAPLQSLLVWTTGTRGRAATHAWLGVAG